MFSPKKIAAFLVCSVSALSFAVPVIVLPQKANLQEKTAAKELALHLKLATGKNIRTVTENASPKKGKRIFVGKTAFARKNKVSFAKFGDEEHFVKAVSPQVLIIAGGHPRGTLYGVYEFLENNLNAMWLDESNIKIDKVRTVTWEKNLQLRGKPAFPYRSIYNNFIQGSELYKIRNRQNVFHRKLEKKYDAYGIFYIHGSPWFCHTFYFYTKDLEEKDHDILSMTNGKRVVSVNSAGPGQICYSNPKTAAHFIKKLREWIPADRKGKEKWQYPFLYGLKTNDNRNECECKNCAALVKKYGWSGTKMLFVNKIAKTFEKQYPEIIFLTDIYGLHTSPPKGVVPNKNISGDIALGSQYPDRPRDHFRPYSDPYNAFTRKLHTDWAALLTSIAIWDYWNDTVRTQYPSNPIPTIAENLKFYKTLNPFYLMMECGGSHVTSLWRMRNVVGYRLMVDPSRDLEKEIRRFADAYYGKGAPAMLKFYDVLLKATRRLKDNIQTYTITNRYDLDEKFFKDAEACLAAADKATRGSKLHNERVNDERVSVEWAKIEKFRISDRKYVERFRKNAIRRIKLQGPYHARRARGAIDRLCRGAVAKLPALKGFEKAAVLSDYGWPLLSIVARYNVLIKDPAAAGGQAVKASSPRKVKEIICGIYDTKTRKYPFRGASLPLAVVPDDGKYHWFYLGRCRLTANSLLYMHSTWTLQVPLAPSMTGPEICDNDVAVYISVKRGKENYTVDRVVVVRGDISPVCHQFAALPQGIDAKKLTAELSRLALTASKTVDPESAVKCSASAGKLTKNGRLWTMMRDRTKKIPVRSRSIPVVRDGKFRIYTVYDGILTRGSTLRLGKISLDLSGYCAMLHPEKKYEIKASVKADSQGRIFIDRVFILNK